MGCMTKLCSDVVKVVCLVNSSKSVLKEMEDVLSAYVPESEISLLSGLFDIKVNRDVLEELKTWNNTNGFSGNSLGDLLLECTNVHEEVGYKYWSCLIGCSNYLGYAIENHMPAYELYVRCEKLVRFIVSLYHTVDGDYGIVNLRDLYLSSRVVMLFDRYGFRSLSDICERYYEEVAHILGNNNEDLVKLGDYCNLCRVKRSMDLSVDLRFENVKPIKVYSDRLLENSMQFQFNKPSDYSDSVDCLDISDCAKRELHTNGIHTISEFFDSGNRGYGCCLSSRVWLEICRMVGHTSYNPAGRDALNSIFGVGRKPITMLVGLMNSDWELDVCKCDFVAKSILDRKHYKLYRDMVYGEKKAFPVSYTFSGSDSEYASSTLKMVSDVMKQLDLMYTIEFMASIECGDVAVNRYTYADIIGIDKTFIRCLYSILGRPVMLGDILEHGKFVVEKGIIPQKTLDKTVKYLQDLGVDTSDM